MFFYKAFVIAQAIPLFFVSIYLLISPIQPRYHPGGPYFYSTFVGYWIPQRPAGEMSREEAEKSGFAYYEVYFNDKGLISKLIKHLGKDELDYQFDYNYEGTKYIGLKSTNPNAIPADECTALYNKYNNKVYKLSSENLVGTLGITVIPESCTFTAYYNITFRTDLPLNPCGDKPNDYPYFGGYNYTGNLHQSSEKRSTMNGEIRPVRQNIMVLPDPFNYPGQSFYEGELKKIDNSPTTTFYWYSDFTSHAKRLKEIDNDNRFVTNNIFEILDGKPFFGHDNNAVYIDQKEVGEKGTAVKKYNLTISE